MVRSLSATPTVMVVLGTTTHEFGWTYTLLPNEIRGWSDLTGGGGPA